ncbi:3-dehydroquinate synthase [Arachidicoccus rhizosphaerae]|uniref:3-dehydroquinate synthase n=1 Tax=Arachidicoccus rhizosphaerae TaxID=551991 RepID=A0A1H3W7R8_9BACT|nr:3-dehydroquinate synthase [Arachidicoccus rhizosphaerae]SDZ83179.1 3-dehydroquinate synthase [Arachidicoccus rhizosphaerae]
MFSKKASLRPVIKAAAALYAERYKKKKPLKKTIKYSSGTTVFHFDSSLDQLDKLADKNAAFIITDDNLYHYYQKKLKGWKVLLIKAGEAYKNMDAVQQLIGQLIEAGADRKSTIIGMGGGVVTDIAGFVASIYLRGVDFGFIPTSVLAMVDASIGGKNGVDVGIFKNMAGIIRQPRFLLYDYSLLKTLPNEEWVGGFAEIIKHACIKDAAMFKLLEQHSLKDFKKTPDLLSQLIARNVLIKAKVVQLDETEQGDRKLLNYGHTLGHAIENTYQLPHGSAVSIGMVVAAYLSKAVLDFNQSERIIKLVQAYGLPAYYDYDPQDALAKMRSDKKRVKDQIHFVLLEKIGKAVHQPLTMEQIAPVVELMGAKGQSNK